MNEQFLKKIASTIEIDTTYLAKVADNDKTIKYLESLNYDSMPPTIKEMNLKLLEESKNLQIDKDKNIVKGFLDESEKYSEDVLKYINSYGKKNELENHYNEAEAYINILNSDLEISAIKSTINDLFNKAEEKYEEKYNDLIAYTKEQIDIDYFGVKKEEKIAVEPKEEEKETKINYVVKKMSMTNLEIKDIIQNEIRKNEIIYNRIIFGHKHKTLSIADRVLDITFKPGVGYIINFVSEPDTNYGKFYQNLLNVFEGLKKLIYNKYGFVVVPEDGKNLNYLNSFYQNYVFVKEKLNTILIKYKLQKSLLNESFDIEYMVFDKSRNKYMIFYTGNSTLSEAIEPYLSTQAKLGPAIYDIEFIPFSDDINAQLTNLYQKMINKVDLDDSNNYLKLNLLDEKNYNESVAVDISGIKVLVDPFEFSKLTDEEKQKMGAFDVIILSNARKESLCNIPQIMIGNPEARLFTSDITYKLARIHWINNMNNVNFMSSDKDLVNYTKRDLDLLNDRVIRITPKGKGYNFRKLINIKFFNSGAIPGSSIVELRDAKHKIIFLGDFSVESSDLLRGTDIDISDYDCVIAKHGDDNAIEYTEIPQEIIKEKLHAGKQVFIFSDKIGNLQHLAQSISSAKFPVDTYAGDPSFYQINRDLAKLIKFGSSWGDNFIEKDKFIESIGSIVPFGDEYEFYNIFQSDRPHIFVLPFEDAEIEMVIKTKLSENNLVVLSNESKDKFSDMINKYAEIAQDENISNFKPLYYNYIKRTSGNELVEFLSNAKKIILLNENKTELDDKLKKTPIYLKKNKYIEIY